MQPCTCGRDGNGNGNGNGRSNGRSNGNSMHSVGWRGGVGRQDTP
ncbi:peptidase [Stenotrophomonas maltophilia]|nr:peptidase [Stenotrophomonas maltophilia]